MRVATRVALISSSLLCFCLILTLWLTIEMKSFYKLSMEISDEFKELEAASWKELRLLTRLKRSTSTYVVPKKECKCPAGPPGPPGPQGLPGDPGKPGSNGGNATNWEVNEKDTVVVLGCIDCPIGPPGSPGEPGIPGNRGVTGLDGHPGDPGTDGEEGEPGWPGEPGEDGWDGEPGLSGEPGTDSHRIINYPGPPGPDGEDGLPGLPGLDGNPGATGHVGPSGDPGTPGEHGVNGPPGAPGVPGDPGPAGNPGGQCPCSSSRKGSEGYRTPPPAYGAPIPVTSSTHRYYVKVSPSPSYREAQENYREYSRRHRKSSAIN